MAVNYSTHNAVLGKYDPSVYPDNFDPLIFFQDANIERAPLLSQYYEYLRNNNFSAARDYLYDSTLDFYGACLLNMIEDRLYTVEDNIEDVVGEKPEIVVYRQTEPKDKMTEECFNWVGPYSST